MTAASIDSRAKKKPKYRKKSDQQAPLPCYFIKLPVELLAEVLLYTKSPRDVLSVARCSKELCYTLLNPTNLYIWKYVRENFNPEPLPQPPKWLGEAAYAALVFDGGICEICGETAPPMWGSNALRLKICRRPECRKSLLSSSSTIMTTLPLTMDRQRPFVSTLPRLEYDACFDPINPHDNLHQFDLWPNNEAKYRTSDWADATQEYLEASTNPEQFEAYVLRCGRRKKLQEEFMELCVELVKWRNRYTKSRNHNEGINQEFTKALATREGLEYYDLINAPSYGPVLRQKNKTIERINNTDYQVRRDAVEAELLKVKEQRTRRTREKTYQNARDVIQKHYNTLRTNKQETPLPTLDTFRQLPIIAQLQKNCGPQMDLEKELLSAVVTSLLHNQLEEWRDKAKQYLADLLGQPKSWNSATTNKLHPVERVTARFRCERCGDRVGLKYANDGCLPFAGVCGHQCPTPPGVKKRPAWKIEKFVKDEKAIHAMENLVNLCGIDVEDKSSEAALKAIGCRIQCNSCPAPIVMSPSNVVGHSHRHENMEMSLLPQEEALRLLGEYPTLTMLAQRLISSEKGALSARQLKVYGCRHCAHFKETPGVADVPMTDTTQPAGEEASTITSAQAVTGGTDNVEVVGTGNAVASSGDGAKQTAAAPAGGEPSDGAHAKSEPLFNFDGFRSHLKSKHNITDPRDEDFFCKQSDEVLRLLNKAR